MIDIVAQELERRKLDREWDPWHNHGPYSPQESARSFFAHLYETEYWERDERDERRMAGKLEEWLQYAYSYGRWVQGCIDQDTEKENAKD